MPFCLGAFRGAVHPALVRSRISDHFSLGKRYVYTYIAIFLLRFLVISGFHFFDILILQFFFCIFDIKSCYVLLDLVYILKYQIDQKQNMKNIKKTIIGIGLFAVFTVAAQNVKEGVISFALTQQKQVSVSTSLLTANAGTWTAPPTVYKTALAKLSTVNVLQSIAKVLHNNPGYYSSKAQLVLVQGELSGFFNVGESLAKAIPSNDTGKFIPTPSFSSTMDRLNVTLDSGRHDEANPINGSWPVGHHQPWGQIFVKDTSKSLCENVTYFFSISVQECYDCFYLNSFISDSRFKFTAPNSGGPPCCSPPTGLTGNGRDIYYMTLAFDNTVNNIYLNPRSDVWVGIIGLNPTPISSS